VPVGDYARDAIDRLPAPQAEAMRANVRSEESDVRGIVGKLVQGAADAGFVYASDVAATGDRLRSITLPRRLSPAVTYSVAVVVDGAEPARARDFVDGLVGGAGGRALLEAGFRAPAGP
jgi:molybdate transport system substrate-binding protein